MVHWRNAKLESFTLNYLHLSVILSCHWCFNKYCGFCIVTKSIGHSRISVELVAVSNAGKE